MSGDGTRVAVVGGGIAGLTTALALTRAGVHTQVFERAEEIREVGAGIQLSPNATVLLHRLGLTEALASVAVRLEAVEMRRWDDDAMLMRTELGDACTTMYGAPYLSVHRADLHRLLLERLPEGVVRLGAHCTGVSEQDDEVRLRFDDGGTAVADAVVGADGIRSVIRDRLVADRPRFSGQAVYRGLVPAGRLPHLLDEPRVQIRLGPGRHCVCYPVSNGRWISFVATAPAGRWRTESWTEPATVEDLVAGYGGWHEEVRRLLSAADSVTRWALHDRDTVSRWTAGRVTLAGDAAHPMLPFGAQGANQGVEDALALALCLRHASPQEVPAALARYEEVRRPRTETVHRTIRQNARNHHFADGEEQQQRDRSMHERWSLSGQEWLFGYDAEAAVSGAVTAAKA